MNETWAKIKTNRMVLIINIIVCVALIAGYFADFMKGRRTIAFVALFIAIVAMQLCVCIAVYRKNKASDAFKYCSIIGCLLIYSFAMFSNDSYFTFTYIFPMTVLYVLYYNASFMKIIGIFSVVLNILKIAFQIYHGHASDTDITSYTVQMAAVLVFSIGMYFLTNLTMKINDEKIAKLLETNKNISALAQKTEEASKAEAELVNNIAEIIPSFVAASKQIANGAQLLAQGAIEQVASIEELSSSISEIAERTKANAEKAGTAVKIADTVKNNAQQGSHQMDEMLNAVE